MNIELPSIEEQRRILFTDNVEKNCSALRANLDAPMFPSAPGFNAEAFSSKHLLTEQQEWESPAPELIYAWFEHFKQMFPEYNSDKKLAALLGLYTSGDRRIRSFKTGEYKIPYGVWRKFLVLTGRVNQEIISVMGFFND